MSAVWVTIGGLVATTVTIKAAGPAALGGRRLPAAAGAVIALLAPALLAALVLTDTFAHGRDLAVDARAAGLACAGAAVLLRAPPLLIVLVAALGAATARAVS